MADEPIIVIDDSDDEAAAALPSNKPESNPTEPGESCFLLCATLPIEQEVYLHIFYGYISRTHGMPNLPADMHSSGTPPLRTHILLSLR